ncbi:MAG: dephospho-CoA kinase [Firmicutes bacterium]|nr:dephospho-CoA kinase [Bacillota bacterium]
MFIIGLTGNIACGKSTVAQMLAEKGALVIDADQLAREVVRPGQPAWAAIVKWLGEGVLLEDGSLDRQKIASHVFNDKGALQKLNALTHPQVISLFHTRSRECAKGDPGKIIVWDVPLLFEAEMEGMVNCVVVVASREETQISRLRERNGFSREEARQRIRSQLELQKKIQGADFVLDNDSTIEFLQQQVDSLWEKLQEARGSRQ